MADPELQHLIKMINQISANIAKGEGDYQQAEKTADHIRRFWAKSMRNKLMDYVAVEKSGNQVKSHDLSSVSSQALSLL